MRHSAVSPKPLAAYLDSVAAGVLLVALLPVLALVAVAIVCESRGAVLVRRRARSEYGEAIDVWMFRATVQTSELFTRVGWILHYTCLEALPSLWDVLVGDIRLLQAVRACSPRTQDTRGSLSE